MTHEELLSTISFFEDAPKEVIDRIGQYLRAVELNRGDVLSREADEPTDLSVKMSDRVVIARDHRGMDDRPSPLLRPVNDPEIQPAESTNLDP